MTPASSSKFARAMQKTSSKTVLKDCLLTITSTTFYTKRLLHQTMVRTKIFNTTQPLHQPPFPTPPFTPGAISPDNFRTRHVLHQATFTPDNFYTKHFLHQTPFTPNNFYTTNPLHQTPFAPRTFYTKHLLHQSNFSTRHLLHQPPSTPESFYTIQLGPQSNQNFEYKKSHTLSTKHFINRSALSRASMIDCALKQN